MHKLSPIKLSLLSGLPLLMLLPCGIFDSVNSPLFKTLFWIHFAMLLAASVLSVCSILLYANSLNRILKIFSALCSMLVTVFCLSSIILPVTARDALIHHLAIPKLWILEGHIYPTLWHPWSSYPMLFQLAFTAILQSGAEQLCSLYIFLFIPLTALMAFKSAYLLGECRLAPPIAAGIIVLIPLVMKLGSVPLVDLPLVFLCGAGLYYLCKLQANPDIPSNIFFAGLAWGLALSCKLNAIPAFGLALLTIGSGTLSLRREYKRTALQYLSVIGIAAVCYSPWLIKNMFWASNPFYPYMTSAFGGGNIKFDSGLSGLNSLQQRIMLYGESMLDVILLPVRIFLAGQDDNPRLFDGILSPLLLLGIALGLYRIRSFEFRQLTLFSLCYIIFSLISTGARVRYLAPVIVVLAGLTASALSRIAARGIAGKVAVAALLSYQIFSSAGYVAGYSQAAEAISYSGGNLSKAEYLNSRIPEYAVISYANSNLPEDARISLIYTGNQFYLYNRRAYSTGHTSADQLLSWLNKSATVDQLYAHFRESAYSHLIINDHRLSSVLDSALNDEKKKLLADFAANYLAVLFSQNGFSLYKLK